MYEIDFNTCTMNDVIRRSVVLHPTFYAEALADVAKIHRQARDTMIVALAVDSAAIMNDKAMALFRAVRDQELDIENLDFSSRIIAFSCAAKLQCLNFNLAHSIAARETADAA